jgi:predicted acylesterase/phospholipase RssA
MSHRLDDKSAPKEYYTNEDEHGPVSHADRINPSALAEGLLLSVSGLDSMPSALSVKSSNKNILKIPPRRLAFCGGGIRCVAHVGVLKALQEAGLLNCVKEVIGVSAGGLFALLYVIGYSVAQIEKLALGFDFRILGNIDPEDLLLFSVTLGLNSGDVLEKLVTSILHQKGFDKDITFEQLAAKTRLGFRCYATELQTSKIKEMSAAATPKMSVRLALRATMSLPIMYSPVPYEDSLLVDGGLLHNLPLIFLTDAEVADTWGVLFVNSPKDSQTKSIDSVIDFFKYVYDGVVLMRNLPCIQKYKERLILIQSDDFNALNFGESKDIRAEFIQKAEEATTAFLAARTRPRRRVSVS